MAIDPTPAFTVEELVPHRGEMSLLDRILAYDADSLCAEVVIQPQSSFCGPDGVPGWVGIEYMAQAIAAWAGTAAKQEGTAVRVGFLLGSRRFSSSCSCFPVGARLHIQVERLLQDSSGLGSFDCSIRFDQEQQQARLNVFQPQDVSNFMESVKGQHNV
ncbi:ApeP family dehydratase [Oceanobacter antarcticus]|uniref:3-hydroxylacyl-ACP dehydratase n=1 Tax=Oceanobacter antarcticus TaxID=3133425 RepID=A0ABW8NM75_9GAMM